MILWKSKEIEFENLKQRWIIEARRWSSNTTGVSIELNNQYKNTLRNQWEYIGKYFSINLTKSFKLGENHVYYDGPHCSFSLGYLHICWSWNDCEKCLKTA